MCVRYFYLPRALARRNYIANKLKNSHVEICFCALCNTPVDLLKVPFKRSIYIYIYMHIYIIYIYIYIYIYI